jgi:hypothetical protein
MKLALQKYNKKGSGFINRCRLYLKIFSLYDLLLFDKPAIHPAYLIGECPLSRSSTIIWPSYPHPPKRYWGVWGHFLRNHIEPILPNIILKWHQNCQLRQFSTFYKHTRTPHLYHKDQDGLTVFPLNRRQNKGYLQLCSIYL